MRNQRQAVAVKWNPSTDDAPQVAAVGSGEIADQIMRIAKENGIPVREDKNLIQVLSLLDTGDAIPTEIYTAIAEILVFIYWTNREYEEILGKA